MTWNSSNRDWPNPTRATVRFPSNEESRKVHELAVSLLGEGTVSNDIAHLVGAFDDSTVQLSQGQDGRQIVARIEHPDFEHWERHLRKDQFGNAYLWNEKMRLRAV